MLWVRLPGIFDARVAEIPIGTLQAFVTDTKDGLAALDDFTTTGACSITDLIASIADGIMTHIPSGSTTCGNFSVNGRPRDCRLE